MTTPGINFAPASNYSLIELANIFTRSFAEYFYPGTTTPETLSRRVREEQIDLRASQVLLVDNAPAGIALIARRGARAWCTGFGVMLEHRGHGYAHLLAAAMLDAARNTAVAHFSLEVLTRNERALRVYERAGLRITRRLLILTWRPGENEPPAPPYPLASVDPSELVLTAFTTLHPVPAAWQRHPATLLSLTDAQGLLLRNGEQRAYVIVSGTTDHLRIHDFGAGDASSANLLLGSLKSHARSITSINEPAESPLTAAFLRNGFTVADEQHELEMTIADS
jgi:ribosomal protein S18 acetylase RimI-like enzyme